MCLLSLQLSRRFPKLPIQIHFHSYKPPSVSIEKGAIELYVFAAANFQVILKGGKLVDVFTMNMVMISILLRTYAYDYIYCVCESESATRRHSSCASYAQLEDAILFNAIMLRRKTHTRNARTLHRRNKGATCTQQNIVTCLYYDIYL